MQQLFTHTERCKACCYCVEACPKSAIRPSGTLNPDGYEVIAIDEEKCVKCGTCYVVCPDLVFELYDPKEQANTKGEHEQ